MRETSRSDNQHKVLVVDDETANLQKMYRTLMGRYPVLTAHSAGEALHWLEKEPSVAVIVTDQRMPDMSGIELLRSSLTTHPNTIRIILTGFADLEVLMEAINSCRVFRYLVKPWEPADLLITVERGMETYQLAVDNEKYRKELIRRERLARELEIAREIQRYILPISLPEIPGYAIAVEYHPAAEVGGDLYDLEYTREDGTLQMVVGDVSGKSVPAALYGAVFSGRLRSLFAQPMSPAHSLRFLNKSLVQRMAEPNYIAVSFLRVELETGLLTFSNAGMPYPYLIRSVGRVERLELPGAPLGLLDESDHEEITGRLEKGDSLIVASDGCIEATDRWAQTYDEDRFIAAMLRHCANETRALIGNLYEDIRRFMDGEEMQDDITILALKRLEE